MKKVENTPNKSQQFDEMEVYRHLRTNIEYSSVDKKYRLSISLVLNQEKVKLPLLQI